MKKFTKLFITTNTLFLFILSFFLFFNKSNVQAYSTPVISNIEVVGYSYDGIYPRFEDTTKPRKSFYDAPYDSSISKRGSVYINVKQTGHGGTRNLVVDNDDGNFVDAKYSDISKTNITYGGILRGYDEVFKITDLKPGYHNIKRLGFNRTTYGKPMVSDVIRVRVCEHATFPTKNDVPVNKTFSIAFNRPVQIGSSTKNFVKVVDSSNREVPINVSASSNPNILEISPVNNYLPNSNYTLKVLPGMKATDGKELFMTVTMNFNTK
ncbi:hypothetical protein A0J52_02385 [Clostridium sporogenes]|uniref:Ig-like domain-containing protein n=1 Tax=Clostridium TaxID=1485 RepID=UPI00077FFFEE|nr:MULTISPECIES: Ig-like domain-containing protein [Clostridium]KYN78145.1 hypothetical protein A0J52_02385 [Clostridium sporogenes]MBE6058340.1 hypothetical protein [Clostridium sp.]NFM17012.1 hypothetical protein [Clostridium sporogenes]